MARHKRLSFKTLGSVYCSKYPHLSTITHKVNAPIDEGWYDVRIEYDQRTAKRYPDRKDVLIGYTYLRLEAYQPQGYYPKTTTVYSGSFHPLELFQN